MPKIAHKTHFFLWIISSIVELITLGFVLSQKLLSEDTRIITIENIIAIFIICIGFILHNVLIYISIHSIENEEDTKNSIFKNWIKTYYENALRFIILLFFTIINGEALYMFVSIYGVVQDDANIILMEAKNYFVMACATTYGLLLLWDLSFILYYRIKEKKWAFNHRTFNYYLISDALSSFVFYIIADIYFFKNGLSITFITIIAGTYLVFNIYRIFTIKKV